MINLDLTLQVECKRAEPRELKELHALQFGGGMFANGLAMQGMALGPGLMSSPYQALAAQQHQLAAAQGEDKGTTRSRQCHGNVTTMSQQCHNNVTTGA